MILTTDQIRDHLGIIERHPGSEAAARSQQVIARNSADIAAAYIAATNNRAAADDTAAPDAETVERVDPMVLVKAAIDEARKITGGWADVRTDVVADLLLRNGFTLPPTVAGAVVAS